jgi:hypothetical protein
MVSNVSTPFVIAVYCFTGTIVAVASSSTATCVTAAVVSAHLLLALLLLS